jgi:hypothetical protein
MALGIWGLKLNMIPPAVLDWARWRFRRTHLDRRNPVAWSEVLDTLPKKIAAAGTPGDEELPAQTRLFIEAKKLRRHCEQIAEVLCGKTQTRYGIFLLSTGAISCLSLPCAGPTRSGCASRLPTGT